jgi:hypothetical protein
MEPIAITFDTANDRLSVTWADESTTTYERSDAARYLAEVERPADLDAMGWSV